MGIDARAYRDWRILTSRCNRSLESCARALYAGAVLLPVALDVTAASPSALPPPTAAHIVEVTSQASVGGGARFDDPPRGTTGAFTMALRADVIVGRTGPRTWGVGPFLSVRTDGFTDVAPALGVSLLLPVAEALPLVLSAGGALRIDATGVAPGALERLWWGARSYNYQSAYTLAAGIFVEARQFITESHTIDVVGGADVDLELIALPFIALYTWIFRRDPGR
jgi:hypothetical protein